MLKKFLRETFSYLPALILPALTGFISAPILTRLFLPAEYGNYALAMGLAEFLFALSCSGFASGAMRFYPGYRERKLLKTFFATLTSSLAMVVFFVSLVTIALWLSLRSMLPADLAPLLLLGLLIFMVEVFFKVSQDVLLSQERGRIYTIFELIKRYGSLTLGLFLVLVFGLNVEGLLLGDFLIMLLALPFLLRIMQRKQRFSWIKFDRRTFNHFWRYAWPLALGNMAMWFLRVSDRYIIRWFRSESEVGLYSVSFNLSVRSIDLLVAMFMLGIGPLVFNAWERQGRAETEKALAMITRYFVLVCIPAATGLTLLGAPFVRLMTAANYHEGYRIVGFIAFSSVFYGLSQLASMGLLIQEHTRRIAINQIFAAAVNIVLSLFLVPQYGFVGAGISTLVGYIILFILQAAGGRKLLKWRVPVRTLTNLILATLVMAGSVVGFNWIAEDLIGLAEIWHLLIGVLLGAGVYFMVLCLVREFQAYEKTLVSEALRGVTVRIRMKGA